MSRINLPPGVHPISLPQPRRDEIVRKLAKQKAGDRLLVYLFGSLVLPLGIIIVGNVTGVDELKSGDLFLFGSGVVIAGLGELQNRSTYLHRWTTFTSWCLLLGFCALVAGWAWSSAARMPPEWLTRTATLVVSVLFSSLMAGAGIYLGVVRDAYEEVNEWSC